MPFNK